MNDITGRKIEVGQKVAVAISATELRTGEVTKITPKKVRVESHIISGTFYPTAILIINEDQVEEKRSLFFNAAKDEPETIINKEPKVVFEEFLKENNITEEDLIDLDFEENRFYDFIYNDTHFNIDIV